MRSCRFIVSVSRDVTLLAYHCHCAPLVAVVVVDIIARHALRLLVGMVYAVAVAKWVGCNTVLEGLCRCSGTYHTIMCKRGGVDNTPFMRFLT